MFFVFPPLSLVTLPTGVEEGALAVPLPQDKGPLVLVPPGVLGPRHPPNKPGVGALAVLQKRTPGDYLAPLHHL